MTRLVPSGLSPKQIRLGRLVWSACLLTGCAGSYLVPLNGQTDVQRKQDARECTDIAKVAGKAAQAQALEARKARPTGEKLAEVATILFVPLYNYQMTDPEKAYWAAWQASYKDCYESRGYRYAVESDYK